MDDSRPASATATEEPESSGDPDSTSAPRDRGHIAVRNTQPDDFPGVVELSRKVYPDDPWSVGDLRAQHQAFPKGQLVAVDTSTGEIVGMAASLLVRWSNYDRLASYNEMTGDLRFGNHDPSGDTLYGAEVMVDPTRRRQGIGSKIYKARRELARTLGAKRILAGARVPGYRHYADRMSAEEYVGRVVRGELTDPTLSFQLSRGFRVVAVVPGYQHADRQSRGYAALIEWDTDAPARSRERTGSRGLGVSTAA